jgi:sulfite reductase (NADPH) flavoprotein alpha-component
MNAVPPLPSLIPENAPFSTEQRAWLNGFFAAYLGVNGMPEVPDAMQEEAEEFPWHEPTLSLPERLALAKDRKPERQLMAALAQLDCGQCGYLCQTYAEAVWSGVEADLGRCVPGGKETQRKLKELLPALEPLRDGAVAAPAVKAAGPVGLSRDRPALATLVDAHPLNRSGSDKDVRHVVFDLSATDVTYEAGDSLGVFARKNPLLVQSVLDRLGATGEEMVGFDGDALPLRQVLLSKVDIARPSDECMLFLATRAFDGETGWLSVQNKTNVIVFGFGEPGAPQRFAAAQPQLAELSKRWGLDLRGFARDFQWAEGITPLLA